MDRNTINTHYKQTITTQYGEDIPYEFELTDSDLALTTTEFNNDTPMEDEESGFLFDEAYQIEFKGRVPVAEKLDYLIAIASGIISGAVDVLLNNDLSLEKARDTGSETANRFVVNCAKKIGFRGDDLESAVRFLEKSAPIASDSLTSKFGGGLQHHFRDFCHHPTIVGLSCSILSQFTEHGYGTDTDGSFITPSLPDDALIGVSIPEKIIFGALNWFPHIISDLAGSSQSAGKGTGIPGPMLSFLKEISCLPIVRKLCVKYKGNMIPVSSYLSKLFNGTAIRTKDGKPVRFDLRAELGLQKELAKMTIPVIINECIVRLSYFGITIRNNLIKVRSLREAKIKIESNLPLMDRRLSRMLAVSFGTLTAIDLGYAALKASMEMNGEEYNNDDEEGRAIQFAVLFLTKINYPNLIRFTIALCKEGAYLVEDLNHGIAVNRGFGRGALDNPFFFELSDRGRELLLSFLVYKTQYDIEQTRNVKNRERKAKWLQEFSSMYFKSRQLEEICSPQMQKALFAEFDSDANSESIECMRCYLALAIKFFKPYYSFHEKAINKIGDNNYLGLHCESDFIRDIFFLCQSRIDKPMFQRLCKHYDYYYRQLANGTGYNKLRKNARRVFLGLFDPLGLFATEILSYTVPDLMPSIFWHDEEQSINQFAIWLAICKEVIASHYHDHLLINYLVYRMEQTIKQHQITSDSVSKLEKQNNKILVSYLSKCIEELKAM